MRSAKEAVAYLKKVHTLVRYLEICDGNMQEGSFRCDANVSVRKVGAEKFGTRAEIKNINSFRFVEKAINYEVARQIDVIEGGGKVVQETRLYDPDKGETRSMRSKEEANDYRYFPDPDLLPVEIDAAYIGEHQGDAARAAGREGRALRTARLACREYDAGVLTSIEGARRVLRGRREAACRRETAVERAGQARRQLGRGFAGRGAQRTQPRDRRRAASARRVSRACSAASPTTPSPARSPRTCSRRCGRRARTPTPSSSRRV